VPPSATATWTTLRWRRLAADDMLAHVRDVVRWPGGYVATGDLAVEDGGAHTRAWTSTDGRRWDALPSDAFGADAVVVGVGVVDGGLVAVTLGSGPPPDEDDLDGPVTDPAGWSLEGPWRSWTSADGRSWQEHPGPPFQPPTTADYRDQLPGLLTGAGNGVVALVFNGQVLAVTRDGVAWEAASLEALPGGPAGWLPSDIVARPPGFVAVGYGPDGSTAISSRDGLAWASHPIRVRCAIDELVDGRTGFLATGEVGDPHVPDTLWCWSRNGLAWKRVPAFAPLGLYTGQEDMCRGSCPNGLLLGDGERVVAYRGGKAAAAWTSPDGRSWTRLRLRGTQPSRWRVANDWRYTKILLPFGMLAIDDRGGAWLAEARS
jgi:hypothetical protein